MPTLQKRWPAKIIVTDVALAAAQAVSSSIISKGGRAKAVALDLSSILSIESTVAFLGHPVDVLINNAGIQLEDFPADRFQ